MDRLWHVQSRFYDLVGVIGENRDRQGRVDHTGIELRTAELEQLRPNQWQWKRLSIGSVGQHRIHRVRHLDDASAQRDLVADQLVWIPRAVYALRVVSNRTEHGFREGRK